MKPLSLCTAFAVVALATVSQGRRGTRILGFGQTGEEPVTNGVGARDTGTGTTDSGDPSADPDADQQPSGDAARLPAPTPPKEVDEDDLPDGWICMKKVVMEEETQWDYEDRCHHVTTQNCYEAFKTEFKPQKMEVCDEKFRKDCFITYKDVVKSETVQICDEELKRDCSIKDGPEVCETRYETVCETRYKSYDINEDVVDCTVERVPWCEDGTPEDEMENCPTVPKNMCEKRNVKSTKVVPKQDCNSVPKKVCGPEVCPITKGDRKCRDEVKHLVQEVPEEECNMVPQKACREEVTIVPSLVPHETCVDVPKEVCTTARVNPRKIQKPVIKRWCGPHNLPGCPHICDQVPAAEEADCMALTTCEEHCKRAYPDEVDDDNAATCASCVEQGCTGLSLGDCLDTGICNKPF